MRVLCTEDLYFTDMDGECHSVSEGEVLSAREVKRPSGRIAIELDTFFGSVAITRICFNLHFVKVAP